MGVRWLQCRVAVIGLLTTLVVGIGTVGAQTQGVDDLAVLRGQVSQLYSQGKYAEALTIAEPYVNLARQRDGDAHIEFATAIAWMGSVLIAQGRYAEAEPLYRRALDIREKALGPEHPSFGTSLNNLAGLYRARAGTPRPSRSTSGRWASAKALGDEHPSVATSLNNLAVLYVSEGRYAEAEPLYQRAMGIRETALGDEHPADATSLNNLAGLYERGPARRGRAALPAGDGASARRPWATSTPPTPPR